MTTLAHKEHTLQDIIDEMTSEERELMDHIVGAAVEDEEIEDDSVVDAFDALSDVQKQAINFIVGALLAKNEDDELAQANLRTNTFLEHFGVKGMKWGVRNSDSGGSTKPAAKPAKLVGAPSTVKLSGSTSNTADERKAARQAVRKGNATATQAHVAALKSTGHRVANAFLGDKTYWKGLAVAAGVAGGVALSPAVLPVGVLGAIGAAVTGAAGGSAVAVAAGSTALTTTGYVGFQLSSTVLGVTNLVRAVRGNSRIDDSYARLGSTVTANYKKGMDRTAKILRKDGGQSGRKIKKALRQSDDLRVTNFLEHHAATSLRAMKSGV